MIKSVRMRWVRLVACMEAMKNTFKIVVKKPEGKRLLEIPRHIRDDNIKIDLKE
jgi:hypothetical protein